jgi:primosomal protein N' (replication factor Y) (superfamily II helicase)
MPTILQIAIPSPLRQIFDYLAPTNCEHDKLQVGTRILVPFGTRKVIGLLVGTTNQTTISESKLKTALAILDEEPIIPDSIMELTRWVSEYYHHPLGDVLANALPALLRNVKKASLIDQIPTTNEPNLAKQSNKILLNSYQKQAVTKVLANSDGFKTFLLQGVTGSGKTEVYLQVIDELLKQGKQALILVPEINLTPQTIARFAERFAVPIATFHSRITDKQRLISWKMAKEGVAKIIIGTRSAIFTPLKNPGIIILDEEHDMSFKQQSGLRYSARNVAIVRGKIENIPIILGSATPSLESLHNVKRKRYELLLLPERAGKAIPPSFDVIDMRNQKLRDGIAESLLQKIEHHLEQKNQILLFLNRRGYAPVLLCHKCGWSVQCKNCDARMTYHQKENHLHCHYCGIIKRVPTKCPDCGADNLLALGTGTERIESSLKKIFPEASVIRIDRDSTRKKGAIEKILTDVQQNNYQILVGTQMLAKGHHFPNVTLVAILNIDSGLFSADFRAHEQTAQLIIQVAGRAGREEKLGEVYLQTHNPQHSLLLQLLNKGYTYFAQEHLRERALSELPPFSYLAIFRAESKNQDAALDFLRQLREADVAKSDAVKVFGPVPSAMIKKAGNFRAQLLLQSNSRNILHKKIDEILSIIDTIKLNHNVKWHIDVDPMELL